VFGLVLVLVGSAVGLGQAPPPTAQLAAKDTLFYLTIPKMPELDEKWGKTQLSELLKDPLMKPFSDHVQKVIEDEWTKTRAKVGIKLDDLRKLPSGEVAMIVGANQLGHSTTTILADVTGRIPHANNVLAKLGAALVKEGAIQKQTVILGEQVQLYELPPNKQNPQPGIALHFFKDNWLVLSSDIPATASVLNRWGGANADQSLSVDPIYQDVMQRCEQDRQAAQHPAADVRWFLRPLETWHALRLDDPEWPKIREEQKKNGEPDLIEVAKKAGFKDLAAIGGYNHTGLGKFDQFYRIAVHAPAPHKAAMKMLDFQNVPANQLHPLDWVPETVSTCSVFHWNTLEVFDGFGALFSEYMDEENAWADMIEQMRMDPKGPKIDIRKDLAALLDQKGTLISDYVEPITPSSRRSLVAIQTPNPKLLTDNVKKSLQKDKAAKLRIFNGIELWELQDKNQPRVPGIKGGPGPNAPKVGKANKAMKNPPGAVCVAFGHLMIATHVELLEKVLRQGGNNNPLNQNLDYVLVQRNLDPLAGPDSALRSFSRSADAMRPTYELIVQGKLMQDESLVGMVLRFLIHQEDQQPQKINGALLPPFQVVRRYLKPGGMAGQVQPQGFLIIGFTLK